MSGSYPYAYNMASTYDSGPEVAPQSNFPEVVEPPSVQHHQYYGSLPRTGSFTSHPHTPVKHEQQQPGVGGGAYSTHTATAVDPSVYTGSHGHPTPYTPAAELARSDKKSRATICGCTLLVFVLSVIIALLSAAVIGLAAGVGIEANRANDANTKLTALNSSSAAQPAKTVTATSATPSPTKFADLDNNCSGDPEHVTGQKYTSFSLLGQQTFEMHCNRDAPGQKLFSLFVSDFNSCMDTCSAYNMYEPGMFGKNINTTCAGVSFIPLWTSKDSALAGGAPGNCYLKPRPQNATGLNVPNIGTECHAAILSTS